MAMSFCSWNPFSHVGILMDPNDIFKWEVRADLSEEQTELIVKWVEITSRDLKCFIML